MMNIIELIKHFNLVMDMENSTSDLKCIRSTICNNEDAREFINHFSYNTGTSWELISCQVPRSYHLYNAWGCQNPVCTAHILIYAVRSHHSAYYNDPFLLHKPLLPCIIKMRLEHQHKSGARMLQLKSIPPEVKKICFEYFAAGLNSVDTRQNLLKKDSKEKNISVPGPTYIGLIHSLWLDRSKLRSNLKDAQSVQVGKYFRPLKHRDQKGRFSRIDDIMTRQNSFLDVIPKENYAQHSQKIQQPQLKQLRFSEDNPYSVLFQLNIPSDSAKDNQHLLYSLSIGRSQSFVSSESIPHIHSVVLSLPCNAIAKKHNSEHSQSSTDFQNKGILSATSEKNNSTMHIIFNIFKEGAASEAYDVSENMCTVMLNDLLLPNCFITRDFEFPLVFTVIDSSEMIYELKQGKDQKIVNVLTNPRIFSVEIKPPSYDPINNTDIEISTLSYSSSLPYEDEIDIYVKEEIFSEDESVNEDNVFQCPIICNVMSCPDAGFSEEDTKQEIGLQNKNCLSSNQNISLREEHNLNYTGSTIKTRKAKKFRRRDHSGRFVQMGPVVENSGESLGDVPQKEIQKLQTKSAHDSDSEMIIKKKTTGTGEELSNTILNASNSDQEVVFPNNDHSSSNENLSPRNKKHKLNHTGSTIQTRNKIKLVETLADKNKCINVKRNVISVSNKTSAGPCAVTSDILNMATNTQVPKLCDQITQTENDTDFSFLVSLLPEFRKISDDKKAALKSNIKNLIRNSNRKYVRKS